MPPQTNRYVANKIYLVPTKKNCFQKIAFTLSLIQLMSLDIFFRHVFKILKTILIQQLWNVKNMHKITNHFLKEKTSQISINNMRFLNFNLNTTENDRKLGISCLFMTFNFLKILFQQTSYSRDILRCNMCWFTHKNMVVDYFCVP